MFIARYSRPHTCNGHSISYMLVYITKTAWVSHWFGVWTMGIDLSGLVALAKCEWTRAQKPKPTSDVKIYIWIKINWKQIEYCSFNQYARNLFRCSSLFEIDCFVDGSCLFALLLFRFSISISCSVLATKGMCCDATRKLIPLFYLPIESIYIFSFYLKAFYSNTGWHRLWCSHKCPQWDDSQMNQSPQWNRRVSLKSFDSFRHS